MHELILNALLSAHVCVYFNYYSGFFIKWIVDLSSDSSIFRVQRKTKLCTVFTERFHDCGFRHAGVNNDLLAIFFSVSFYFSMSTPFRLDTWERSFNFSVFACTCVFSLCHFCSIFIGHSYLFRLFAWRKRSMRVAYTFAFLSCLRRGAIVSYAQVFWCRPINRVVATL